MFVQQGCTKQMYKICHNLSVFVLIWVCSTIAVRKKSCNSYDWMFTKNWLSTDLVCFRSIFSKTKHKVSPLLVLIWCMQVKACFPLISNISYTWTPAVTQCIYFSLTFCFPVVFFSLSNKGMQAKAVATNHREKEGHSVHQGSTGRWHWELHLWITVWELCGMQDNWAIRHR